MEENQEKEPFEEKKEEELLEETQESEQLEEIQESEQLEEMENETVEESQQRGLVEVKAKKAKKGSYITGTIGTLVGAIIASIPWVLTYLYAGMTNPILAILVAGGAFLGYKLFRGKKGKGMPYIITIISLLVITFVTTVVCPIILIYQSGFYISMENLVGIYSRKNIKIAILEDFAIALLFTIIGIVPIVRSIVPKKAESKRKIKAKKAYEKAKKQIEEQIETVKTVCTTLNCVSKEKTLSKKEILNELEMTHNVPHKQAKKQLKTCLKAKILKKYKGKYYYNEEKEAQRIEKVAKKKSKRTPLKTAILIIISVIILGAAGIVAYAYIVTDYIVPNTNVRFKINDNQVLYGTKEEIINAFGEQTSEYYDFIIKDSQVKNSGIYGQVMDKSIYEGYNFTTLMQADRDYYALYIGEEATSQVEDKDFGLFKKLKSYNYTYEAVDENEYRDVIYLYEAKDYYIFINVYSVDLNIELTQIDSIIKDLFI